MYSILQRAVVRATLCAQVLLFKQDLKVCFPFELYTGCTEHRIYNKLILHITGSKCAEQLY